MKKEYKLKRPIPKKVRFNKQEWSYIESKIEKSPFNNFQNFARVLLITGEIRMIDYSELEKLNREVNRIGNNINQITKLAHKFDEISNADIQNLQKTIEDLKHLVSRKLDEELQQERTI
ncbi:plasmid mobilization protein [Enterococcus sp. S22(2020)]|nr:plasmid mobilization relaxosome protein MobC [Enterococcus sp. S22(2020)]MCA5014568.1 plasmid mobilization relaxosome protein MobC [Enterococcus sp. S23]MCA5017821.1 plasmid mobilization relaxosome protein MobC [Enterococcus sp. S22(2020)]